MVLETAKINPHSSKLCIKQLVRAAANSVVFMWNDEVIVVDSTTDPPMPFTKPTVFVLWTSSGVMQYLLHTATSSPALPFHVTSTESNVTVKANKLRVNNA